jgi:hypothetical protein
MSSDADSKFESSLKIKLFPHQITSVKNMEDLEKNKKVVSGLVSCDTQFGILGDIPGYGKSYSIISLLSRDKMEWREGRMKTIKIDIESPKLCNFYYEEKLTEIRENLLVASTSILSQWETYFEKSDLKILTITTKSSFKKFVPNTLDVVLISSTMLNSFLEFTQDMSLCWKRFIYDEPATTHIPAMKPVNAGFIWFVTASYKNLRCTAGVRGSKSHFLKSIFRYMIDDQIEMLTIVNSEDYIKKSFAMPETHFRYHRWFNPSILKVLQNHISKEISQMIEANNIKGALESLGAQEETDIISLVTRKKREELQLAEMKESFYQDKPEHREKREKWEGKIKNLKKDIENIEENYKNVWENDCCICYSSIENPILLPECNHIFCGRCILEWYKTKNTCPMCRQKNSINKLISIEKDEKKEQTKESKSMTKPKIILDLIRKNPEGKFIIFSDHDETFEFLKLDFMKEHINWAELTGRAATKNKKLKSFKSGDHPVIFLNSKVNSAGINLEECTDIILYHDMGYDIQNQILGRANRIGRKQDLIVHKFNK